MTYERSHFELVHCPSCAHHFRLDLTTDRLICATSITSSRRVPRGRSALLVMALFITVLSGCELNSIAVSTHSIEEIEGDLATEERFLTCSTSVCFRLHYDLQEYYAKCRQDPQEVDVLEGVMIDATMFATLGMNPFMTTKAIRRLGNKTCIPRDPDVGQDLDFD